MGLKLNEIIAWIYISWLIPILYGSSFLIIYIFIKLLYTPYWYITVAACTYMIFDRRKCIFGERMSHRFRRWNPIARWIASLLPVRLIRTEKLDPNKNYIFGVHPHGTVGILSTFMSEATGFSKLFEGIQPHMAVTSIFFYLFLWKELFVFSGAIAAESVAIDHVLSKKKGRAVIIAVGGAYEVMDIHPGTMIITLKTRKGFVRKALKHGASLVPVINFGDNDQLYQLPNPLGSRLRTIQQFIYNISKIPPVCLIGVKYGWLAYRKPVNTIVGKPINVDKNEDPSEEIVDALHSQYIEDLKELFNENKDKYANNKDLTLTIN